MDITGQRLDLSGVVVALALKPRDAAAPVISVNSNNPQVVVSPLVGEAVVTVDATDTGGLTPGMHMADMQLTYPDGRVMSSQTVYLYVEEDISP